MANDRLQWVCPHCKHAATISMSQDIKHGEIYFTSKDESELVAIIRRTDCPNPDCKRFVLDALLFDEVEAEGDWENEPKKDWKLLRSWSLVPETRAEVFPDYVPVQIRNDYTEACTILEKSPKAAATMARRALQGMIRDFFGISKPKLIQEIEAIKGKVDPLTWDAINSTRKIGNIGAHMEKDVDLIIEVDPGEAEQLVRLVEMLIKDWYVGKYERERQLSEVVALAGEKEALRKGETSTEALPESLES